MVVVAVERMAHGGEGIGFLEDGRVAFIAGAIPGDTVEARLTTEKPRWARAELVRVVEPSPQRVAHTCPAAAAGAGCCDYSHVAADAQLDFKRGVLRGELNRQLRDQAPAEIEALALEPLTGWRTRVRLGVDGDGRAGVRRARSADVIASGRCTQPVPGLMDGLVGEPASTRFTPGSEVVAVMDSQGERHVVETRRAQRGKRTEHIERVVEGSGTVAESVHGHQFTFPATAFWQAHVQAPETYSRVIAEWGKAAEGYRRGAAWDLYGGVGAFVPAIHQATGSARIHTVDSSPAAASAGAEAALAGAEVEVHAGRVERVVEKLDAPSLVVLDPPRAGAGDQVVAAVAQAQPERVIHIGCDPATLARDLRQWNACGYGVERMLLVDAFPNTHHFETIALLTPAIGDAAGGV